MNIRNRIKEHRQVRAGDLVPHELNWRNHPETQRSALAAIYEEVGFARSLLAYELPDGKLKLIDGHLRRDIDPDMLVDVEVLDVDDVEARKLLLSIDSLASLAEPNDAALDQLLQTCHADAPMLNGLWRALRRGSASVKESLDKANSVKEQFLILVECADENEQVQLLERFCNDGITCRALMS